jgi:phosphonatase-like hydrolase
VIELAAFDIAGTTVDDHGAVYRALADAVIETGASVAPADLQTWMGADKSEAITQLIRLGGREPKPEIVAATFDRFRAILNESYRATPPVALGGAADAIAQLRNDGIKVALTTGFTTDVALSVLGALDWTIGPRETDTIDALVTTSDVRAGRPAPHMIHRAMELTGVFDVRKVVAAGDTVVDLQAAHNAGVMGVGVLTGQLTRWQLARQPHTLILDSVAEIPPLLSELVAK